VARQPLPGYTLSIQRASQGPEVLAFRAVPSTAPLRPGGSFASGAKPVRRR
jgi:hypothetical protein